MKSGKGIQGPAPEHEKDTKMGPQGAKMEPRGHKVKPQGSRKYKKSATWTPRDSKWSPWCHIGAPRCPKMQNTHKKLTQIAKKHTRRCPKVPNKEEKPYTHKQPTNQPTNRPKQQRGTQRNKQSNKHTHAQELRTAHTNTNSRGRVLAEGDVDPAAGSPKEPFRL